MLIQRKKIFPLLLVLLTGLFLFSCKKEQVKDDGNNGKVPVNDNRTHIDKKYLVEGFITENRFRTVIIATKEECEEGTKNIEEKSRNRAIVSLQKYIQSIGNYTGLNTRSGVLNLVIQNGSFSSLNKGCSQNNIYYFDIEKENIKGHLKRISIR